MAPTPAADDTRSVRGRMVAGDLLPADVAVGDPAGVVRTLDRARR